jgi:hypothetical protein
MTLETRGHRPDPITRGLAAVYIWKQMDRHMRLVRPTFFWELWAGVPCGPYIPKPLIGLREFLSRSD